MKTGIRQTNKLLFSLGNIVGTPGAIDATTNQYRLECLGRHLTGDWGCCCDEDKATNDEAVKAGFRILSAYPLDPALPCKGWGDNTLWIITGKPTGARPRSCCRASIDP